MKRAALYARVSTADKGQDPENQLRQLREYCARQGWAIVEEYIDHASGKTGDRQAFRRLFLDASKRQFDVLVVWALDRMTRQGVLETFEYIRDLGRYGVQFESFTEPQFRTTGPAGELMLAVTAWIAQQERIRLAERAKAGLERARANGKQIGRPRRVFPRSEVIERKAAGQSWRQIAAALGVGVGTARRAWSAPMVIQKPA
jgi:DNA invertase Pin-like site-specific DNA recombinase